MFTTTERLIGVHGISQEDIDRIKVYLQGAVYAWCNSEKKHKVFRTRIFLGGENGDWNTTPVQILYDYYRRGGQRSHQYAHREAGKAAGRLLKIVLSEDARVFEIRNGHVKGYKWRDNQTRT